ncbi:Acidic mammalian chitinase [Golovinomyces cichoracearum]|uniref:chitinase n=1 Tax=Golovinomyces cichoracearum TaxID=62708 RepID=A0A420I671_9PEZI|nr:Acidic mammalian chitinase [Golovinomyces cichoracearum]
MFHLLQTALSVVFLIVTAQARYVFYYDQYHIGVPDKTITKGIDHVILAFANSSLFTTEPAGNYTPFEDIPTLRSRFEKGTKIMISIGGWADTVGFGVAAATEKSRKLFAANIADLLVKYDFDGCDIDWEYPGGNGAYYRQVPNSEKVSEIETFPMLLAEIRKAISDKKLLTIATPGKRNDMIAYTPEQAPSIWKSVDWVNVMTYDLMNRRDTVTKFHTDVKSSRETIDYYINELHLTPEKINLGFAMYSKWSYISSNETCTTGLGCKTELMEASDGSDTGRSGTVTFQAENFAGIPTNMTLSTDGTCGVSPATFCADDLCCSPAGFW